MLETIACPMVGTFCQSTTHRYRLTYRWVWTEKIL